MGVIPVVSHYELQWKSVRKSYMVPIEKFAQKMASVTPSMNAKRCLLHAIKMRLSKRYCQRKGPKGYKNHGMPQLLLPE